jgi:hypothetical protein
MRGGYGESSPARHFRRAVRGVESLARRPPEIGTTDPLPWARMARGYDQANVSVANNSYTGIDCVRTYNLDAGDSGEGVFEAHSGTPDTLEILVNGWYAVTVCIDWFDSFTTGFYMGFTRNVAPNVLDYCNMLSSSGTMFLKTWLLSFTGPNDIHLAPLVYQASGSAKNLDACFLQVVRLGDHTGETWEEFHAQDINL